MFRWLIAINEIRLVDRVLVVYSSQRFLIAKDLVLLPAAVLLLFSFNFTKTDNIDNNYLLVNKYIVMTDEK